MTAKHGYQKAMSLLYDAARQSFFCSQSRTLIMSSIYKLSATTYTFRNWSIPEYMMPGIRRYLEHGVPPGDFLSAVISNDLFKAYAHGDDINLHNMPAYVAFFYNEAPASASGSKEKMKAWMELKQRTAHFDREFARENDRAAEAEQLEQRTEDNNEDN